MVERFGGDCVSGTKSSFLFFPDIITSYCLVLILHRICNIIMLWHNYRVYIAAESCRLRALHLRERQVSIVQTYYFHTKTGARRGGCKSKKCKGEDGLVEIQR